MHPAIVPVASAGFKQVVLTSRGTLPAVRGRVVVGIAVDTGSGAVLADLDNSSQIARLNN
jgi:hypothetical protein